MNAVWMALILGPPALFGITVAIDDWRAERRYRRERAMQQDRNARHPSRHPIGPEDMPDWGKR